MPDEPLTLKDLTSDLPPTPAAGSRLDTIGIVGGGTIGRGIAQTLSAHGLTVRIVEKDEACAQACLAGLADNMDRDIQRWAMTTGEKRALLSRITVGTDIAEAAAADFLIEAVDEDFALKRDILHRLDALRGESVILASSASTISLTKIAAGTQRPGTIIGLHFSNPVPKTPLCEIVRAFHTSEETFQRTRAFIHSIGKTPVEVYEYPGFITTRVIVPMLNEAMYVLMEGVASAEDIDTAMRLGFNLAMGPLELADSMGLEELLAWMEAMFHEFGDAKYRPCPLLRRLVREQKYGRKSGEGFFLYDESGNRIKQS
jgi:3-hydroxybutyryl-CoA dehydrogenase